MYILNASKDDEFQNQSFLDLTSISLAYRSLVNRGWLVEIVDSAGANIFPVGMTEYYIGFGLSQSR